MLAGGSGQLANDNDNVDEVGWDQAGGEFNFT
jgi:hypothetical protein